MLEASPLSCPQEWTLEPVGDGLGVHVAFLAQWRNCCCSDQPTATGRRMCYAQIDDSADPNGTLRCLMNLPGMESVAVPAEQRLVCRSEAARVLILVPPAACNRAATP